MMTNLRITYWIMLFSFLLIGNSCKHTSTKQEQSLIEWNTLPDLPGTGLIKAPGVSAAFTGVHNNMLLVGGGCNFPNVPVAEGGTKQYYDDLFALDLSDNSAVWQGEYKLPYPVAYGASVTTDRGILCIGGNNSTEKFASVFLLSWNKKKGKPEITSLPDLPYTMDNLGAAAIGHDVYAVGGNCDGTPSNYLFRLDLDNLSDGWVVLQAYPGAARLQPVVVTQQVNGETQLFMAAGYQPPIQGSKPIVATNILVFSPSTKHWMEASPILPYEDGTPRTLVGGSGVAYGNEGILFMGGVNYTRFLEPLQREQRMQEALSIDKYTVIDSIKVENKAYMLHPEAWYQFNTALLVYKPQQGTWTNLGEYPQLARAGAGTVFHNKRLFIINGELKPGIRTPQVNYATYVNP